MQYFTGIANNELSDTDFKGCTSLKELTIPDGIKKLRHDCFYGLTSLEKINIPDSLVRIDNANALRNCNLKKFEAYGRIEYIGGSTFRENRNLVSCVIPNAVIDRIEADLFRDCISLNSFEIPETVMLIGGASFSNGISLRHLIIPQNVTEIRYGVFGGCTSMEYFILSSIVPPTLTNPDSFNNTNNCPIYVPNSSLNAYKTAESWNKHASRIKPMSEFVG